MQRSHSTPAPRHSLSTALVLRTLVLPLGLALAGSVRGQGLCFDGREAFAIGSVPMIAVGDLDGDGDLDLAGPNINEGRVSVLLNQGDGRFGPRQTYTVGLDPTAVALGDLNGDGQADLVVTSQVTAIGFNGVVNVLTNLGNGTFGSPVTYSAGIFPRSVAVGDLAGLVVQVIGHHSTVPDSTVSRTPPPSAPP